MIHPGFYGLRVFAFRFLTAWLPLIVGGWVVLAYWPVRRPHASNMDGDGRGG